MTSINRRTALAAGSTGLAALGLAACGSDGDGGGDGGNGGGNGGGAGDTITLGYVASWTDGLSTAYLLQNRLEAMGYEVEHQQIEQPGAIYSALADGGIDIYPSAWPEVTHAGYMDEFGENLEDLAGYYEGAVLTIAVPEYTDITSIADLQGNADMFGGRIVGIEPGAGLTEQTQDSMMPTYELEGEYELVTSSTAAMLAELESAVNAEEDIVVTLWRPFWANAEYPVKDLEDPEGAMGEAETLHFLAREGFSEEYPDIAEFIGGILLDDEQYGALEDLVVNQYDEGQELEAVEQWLEENPDVLPEVEEG